MLSVVDVDHFKQINDQFGHDVGDRVLQLIATTLSHNLSEDTLLGRYGGERVYFVLG
ncbi:diguanylate cyclase [Vibrio sp. PP-XX7]